MALIVMAVYDTEENKRTELTKRTLISIQKTVKFPNNRLIVVDNNSCDRTKDLISDFLFYRNELERKNCYQVIRLHENIGTAEAVNQGIRERLPGENVIKIDNDVIINHYGWIDEMEAAIVRDSKIGIVGLKRKDCLEDPNNTEGVFKSTLRMLPHKPGEAWIIVEEVNHVMGTCQMLSSALLDKVGYFYQPGLYGFDDSLMDFRSRMAGFTNVFLPHINIDHIDPGDTPYQTWKEKSAGKDIAEYYRTISEYKSSQRDIYYNPFK